MELYEKEIGEREINAIITLKNNSLLKHTLFHSISGHKLFEYKGTHENRNNWDIVSLYTDTIKPFHDIKVSDFSTGIYCFMTSNSCLPKLKDYRLYLLKELSSIIKLKKNDTGRTTLFCEKILNITRNTLLGMIEDGIDIHDFCLLHGDLYSGNIMRFDGRYALIDFEYLRYGPANLEIAFLLFWDLITEINEEKRIKRRCIVRKNILSLLDAKIISICDYEIIMKLYVPMILCCSLQYCNSRFYLNPSRIEDGVIYFYLNEYFSFMDPNAQL